MYRAFCTAMIVVVLGAIPAAATHEPPRLRTERVYFTCLDGERLQDIRENANRFSGWSTVAPANTRTSGAGCMSTDGFQETQGTNGPGSPLYDVQWSGTFVGNLDSVAFEGYAWARSAADPASALKYSLAVDGEPVHSGAWVPAKAVSSLDVSRGGFVNG